MSRVSLRQIPLKKRVAFYQQMSELYKAGVPLVKISELPSLWDATLPKRQILVFQNNIRKGESLTVAMKMCKLFTKFDISVIESAEASGQLIKIFDYLAARYKTRIKFIKNIRGKSMRPMGSLVAALFLFPVPKLFSGDLSTSQYLLQTVGVLAFVFAVIYFLYLFISSALNDPQKEPVLSAAIAKIPVIGSVYNLMGLEDFFNALQLLTESGVQIMPACKQVALSNKNSNIKGLARRISISLDLGLSMSEAFTKEPLVGSKMHIYLETSESTGEINKAFNQIGQLIRDDIQKKINIVAAIVPKLIFFILVIYITLGLIDNMNEKFKMLESI
ncbi:type II secretion system F family protein [bacterium]|nr:type II secretion system F family protein [bacterium]MDB2425937.1 type II secretion system F family protein [bacterium]